MRKIYIFLLLLLGSFYSHAQFPLPYCSEVFNTGVEPITNVTFAGINNTSPAAVGGPAHQNFLSITGGAVTQGMSYTIEVQGNTDGDYEDGVSVFFDWNNDNDFIDMGERFTVGILDTTTGTDGIKCSTNIIIPFTSIIGNVRMRVSKKYAFFPAPCNVSSANNYGEAEDYIIVVSASTGCTGAPAAGTISGPSSACSAVAFNLTNTGATSLANMRYAWQRSADNVSWVNLNNTSTLTTPYAVSQTATTFYRLVDTCTTSGQSAISNVLQITMNPFSACYCVSGAAFAEEDDIFNVTVGTLNNSSNCTTTGGAGSVLNSYSNYTGIAAPSLAKGVNTPFSIAINTCGTIAYFNSVSVYIDYNQNGFFSDAGEQVYLSSGLGGVHTINSSFTIPAGATLGNTRMRVVLVTTNVPANVSSCGVYAYGETEDYTINITAPPACVPVSGITVTTRTPTFLELNWNAVAGSAGYEYVVDELPGDPAGAGTPEAGNSGIFVFGTYDPNKIYYVHVRNNCGASGFSAWTKALSVPCVTNLSPTDGATNVSVTPTFNWTPVVGATKYAIYFSDNGGVTYFGSAIVTAPPVNFVGFAYNTPYKWFVRAINGADSSAFTCEATNGTSFTTIAAPPPPVNDACANAIDLSVSNGFCATPLLGRLISADSTAGLGNASCAGLGLKYDVWYKATIPATGNLTIQTSAVNTYVSDLVLQAYSGTCGALVPIGCDDDGNTDPAPSDTHSKLGLTGRTPNEVIYYRVMAYDQISRGEFAICAFDTTSSVRPLVAAGVSNGCTPNATVNIDSVWKYTWVTFRDGSGSVMGQVYPNGSKLGNTAASVYINNGAVRIDGNNIPYLDRNITVTPTTQPTGQVLTRMFFTNAELNALGAVAGGALRGQLNSSKTAQTCATSALAGDGRFINQFSSAAYGANHQVDVLDTVYSTFYFHKGNIVLPVNYAELTGSRNGNKVDLNWVTKTEINNKSFEIQRSADGRSFAAMGSVNSKAIGGNSVLPISYNYTDILPLVVTNYYRLKQTDIDGKTTYSNTVLVKGIKPTVFSLNTIFPNPAKERITAALQSPFADNITLVVTDITGKIIKRQVGNMAIGDNIVTMDVASLPAGTYLLKAVCNNGCESAVRKFTKQ